ncbi:MAG: substrate-binding domain-containing protein [Spirochaetales bacterium]|jgi:ribose transport system substrate-binding protein|nr:substrate-binding domain-containing protein [Spirochaetales bacterium]
MKKKMIGVFLLSVFVALNGFAGGSQDSPAASGPNAQRTLVFIPKATNSQFWVAIWDGAQKAAQELGYKEVKFQGTSSTADVTGQINIVADVTTSRPAGIIVAVNDAVALKAPIEKAIESGVPVVTVNAGVNSDKIPVHVATDNYNAAAMGADALAKLIGEKGTVIFIGIDATSENGRQRENGFRDQMKKYPNIRILPTQHSQGDISRSMNVTSDLLTGNPDVVGIFCAQDNGGTGAAQTLKQRGQKDKIKLVAFDSSPDEFQLFLDDFLDALVVQDPFMQGYQGIYSLDKVINGKPIETDFVETPVTVVTKQNISEAAVYDIMARNSAIKDMMTNRGITPKN